MAVLSKRKKLAREKVDPNTHYSIDDALTMVKELATAKFPESIDVSVNLGVDVPLGGGGVTVGGSLTGATVIETVASSEPPLPSLIE